MCLYNKKNSFSSLSHTQSLSFSVFLSLFNNLAWLAFSMTNNKYIKKETKGWHILKVHHLNQTPPHGYAVYNLILGSYEYTPDSFVWQMEEIIFWSSENKLSIFHLTLLKAPQTCTPYCMHTSAKYGIMLAKVRQQREPAPCHHPAL